MKCKTAFRPRFILVYYICAINAQALFTGIGVRAPLDLGGGEGRPYYPKKKIVACIESRIKRHIKWTKKRCIEIVVYKPQLLA